MSDRKENLLVKQQKYRATRIDPNYPSKPNALRRWMRLLALSLPLIGIVLLAILTFNPVSSVGRMVYEPGPVSAQHSFFNHRCEDCHENKMGKFGLVSNAKCRVCHDGPLHDPNQVCPSGEKLIRGGPSAMAGEGKDAAKQVTFEEPRCASCHTEHKGNQKLVQMTDNHCTQCHGDLKVKGDAKLTVAKSIVNFTTSGGHEDWRILRSDPAKPEGKDLTPIRFNHQIHMRESFDPSSRFGARKMQCGDCHMSTETNLESLSEDTTRLASFEKFMPPAELDSFYEQLSAANGVSPYRLTRSDLRKLTGEALNQPALSNRFEKLRAGNWRDLFSDGIVAAIREHAGKSPAPTKPDSEELKLFETSATPTVINEFYDVLARVTFENHLVPKKLERQELRAYASEAFENHILSDRLMTLVDRKGFKDDCETTILNLLRERLANTPSKGQTRYMLPITYEKNCATECHWHKLPTLKLSDNTEVIPPHGKASEARRILRDAIFADVVWTSLQPQTLSAEDKAVKVLVKRLRDALEMKAGDAAITAVKDASARNALLVKTMNDADPETYIYVMKIFSASEAIDLLGGVIDQNTIKRYAGMKPDKKNTLNDNISTKLETLINAYADDRPVNAATLNAMAEERLAEASKKLFGPKDAVRARKEKGACLFCHEPTTKSSSRPDNSEVVADVHIPNRWLNHSVFNHETHRVIDCESCHDRATTSDKTSDVLLPGIQKCQECHKPGGARTDCIECHLYHDKTHQTRDRYVSIEDLMKTGASGVKVRAAEGGAKLPENTDVPPGEGPPRDGPPPPPGLQGPPPPQEQPKPKDGPSK